ncbi:hypothetical protein ACFL52_02650 [Candidatus Margulisiibacteriota bacterium]
MDNSLKEFEAELAGLSNLGLIVLIKSLENTLIEERERTNRENKQTLEVY